MTLSSERLSRFIRDARAYYGLSQEQVAVRGGPYRQMQGWIENGDRDEVDDSTLAAYDRAYQWPTGYAAAVAQNGAELERYDPNSALLGGPADAASYPGGPAKAPGLIRKTLAAQQAADASDQHRDITCLGFSPEDGSPVHQFGALVTNINFRNLRSVVNAHHGVTIFDTTVVDAALIHGVLTTSVDESYRAGQLGPEHGGMKRIAVDPLSDLYDIGDAKRLAAALIALRPDVPTTLERAAFTFLAIAAFGGDPLVTITHLKASLPPPEPPAIGLRDQFLGFWRTFYNPDVAGPALSLPDLAACDLLAGILAARDSALKIVIGEPHNGRQRKPSYEAAATVRSSELLEHEKAFVFYDGDIAPELPTCITHVAYRGAATFYRVTETPREHGTAFTPAVHPAILHRSIGIANAHDLAVLSQHDRERMGTLTNYASGFAVYCDGGTARRLWIPDF